jgi:hypothetical protein
MFGILLQKALRTGLVKRTLYWRRRLRRAVRTFGATGDVCSRSYCVRSFTASCERPPRETSSGACAVPKSLGEAASLFAHLGFFHALFAHASAGST